MDNEVLKSDPSTILQEETAKLQLYEIDRLSINDLTGECKNTDEELVTVLTALFVSLNQGSLCLKLSAASIAKKTVSTDPGSVEKTLSCFISSANSGRYEDILSINGKEYKPLVMKENSGDYYLYFQKYFHYEEKLKSNINKFISAGSQNVNNIPSEIKSVINEEFSINDKPCRLNQKQKMAVISSILFNFVIISGGPGTGKTHIISQILRCFVKSGILPERIGLVSPTGKAAQKISYSVKKSISDNDNITGEEKKFIESTECKTIHRLLKYDPSRNAFHHDCNNRLDVDVIIIDEVSMVDMVLMSKLLDALPDECRIILIGDKDQLPSVEAGAVLAGLIPDEREYFDDEFKNIAKTVDPDINLVAPEGEAFLKNRVIILDENFRSSSSLFEASMLINKKIKTEDDIERIFGLFVPLELKSNDLIITGTRSGKNGFFIDVPENNFHLMKKIIGFFFDKYFMLKNKSGFNYADLLKEASKIDFDEIDQKLKIIFEIIFELNDRLKILTLIREGFSGCNFINRLMRDMLFHATGDDSGYPVLMTHNDYLRNLFNGDTGVVLRDKSGRLKVIFRNFDNFRIYDYGFIQNLESGFSITVHKSQGSEYNDVLVVLPDNRDNPLLSKEIIYTALTRAKRNCFIYGSKEVFAKSISNQIERESGIGFWR